MTTLLSETDMKHLWTTVGGDNFSLNSLKIHEKKTYFVNVDFTKMVHKSQFCLNFAPKDNFVKLKMKTMVYLTLLFFAYGQNTVWIRTCYEKVYLSSKKQLAIWYVDMPQLIKLF